MRQLTNDEVDLVNGGDLSVTVDYTTGCAQGLLGGAMGSIATTGPWGAAAVFWGGGVAGGCFSGGLNFTFTYN